MRVTARSKLGALSSNGFSVLATVVIILVVLALGTVGWFVYQHHHKNNQAIKSSQQEKSPNTTEPTNLYVGWKNYCDSVYGYCFNYPGNWTFKVDLVASTPCDVGQVTLTSPDQLTSISYINASNHDVAFSSNTVTNITSFSNSGALDALGQYTTYGNQYLPILSIVNADFINTYQLTTGQAASYPTTPQFTDKNIVNYNCNGKFTAQPLNASTTAYDAKAWFNTADGQTSLKVLESFYSK